MEARTFARALGLVAVLILALGVTSASAASPVLQFETPGSVLPVPFTAEGGEVTAVMSNFDTVVHCSGSTGEGAITGARSTRSNYRFTGCETQGGTRAGHECKSTTGAAGEIQTPPIEAELIFISQASKEVGMLLDPHGGTYMEFECAGENVKALGPFVSPIHPVNVEGTSFTASLFRSGAIQVPSAYESLTGGLLPAVPSGESDLSSGTTGVELSFAIHTSLPLTVRAISAAEVEAEAKRRDDEAAAKKRHDDEEAAKAAAAKKRGEEEADKKRGEEEAEQRSAEKRAKEKARVRHRAKALKQCRKANTKRVRVRCERRAKKRFAVPHPNRRY